ncbi:MAG: hypothetical protein HY912_09030 [Desulfomonile tiedjei]|uniref:Uncharacterized protein n=1 Tax=Desulfomonile tiedjei TaxID=2358 RepID=A0A9D6V2S0_9BACT|nr:hypothetical protein [Desulfomonile tiedjei]
MERLSSLFKQVGFHIFLFFLSLVLFGWPVVHFSDMNRLEPMFYYLFGAWGVVIFLLFLVSRSVSDQAGSEEDENGKK